MSPRMGLGGALVGTLLQTYRPYGPEEPRIPVPFRPSMNSPASTIKYVSRAVSIPSSVQGLPGPCALWDKAKHDRLSMNSPPFHRSDLEVVTEQPLHSRLVTDLVAFSCSFLMPKLTCIAQFVTVWRSFLVFFAFF